ncbi:MAG: hypothetical protein M1837_006816 [Sclerophora amabilis]|nr:MAG: hypothetical protein M1837_006816 [Sclerophora amabilis]
MGNVESTPESRQPLKLTKPKTIGSTSNLVSTASQSTDLFSSSAGLSSIDIDTDGLEDPSTPTDGGWRSDTDVRQRLRLHLFGSGDEIARFSGHVAAEGRIQIESEATRANAQDGLSRSSTSSEPSSSSEVLSTPLTILGGSRPSLIADSINTTQIREPRNYGEAADRGRRREPTASKGAASTADSDLPLAGPQPTMRSRSLLTPGIATRGKPSNVLCKAPPPQQLRCQADRDYYYNPSLPESSPLAWLAALDLAEDGRKNPIPRTSTPQDLEYSHLSGLKRGTLHITNGIASPIPSVRAPRDPSRGSQGIRGSEDYFFASEGCRSGEDAKPPIPPKAPRRRRHTTVSGLPDVQHGCVGSQIWVHRPRCESPRKNQPNQDEHDHDMSPNPMAMTVKTKSESSSEADISQRSSDRALAMAQEYMDELPSSPFSFVATSFAGGKPAAQSRAAAVDDDLFDDYLSSSRPSSVSTFESIKEMQPTDSGQSREDALRVLSGADKANATNPSSEPSRSKQEVSSRRARRTVETADSGYSSNVSLYSLRREECSDSSRDSGDGSPWSTSDPLFSDCVPEKLALPPRPQRAAPTRPSAMTPNGSTEDSVGASGLQRSSSFERKTGQDISLTTPAHPSALPPDGSGQTRKLKKRRPSSRQYLKSSRDITVVTSREFSQQQVPPVPAEVAAKLAEHLESFPNLDHTFPNPQSTRSDVSTDSDSDLLAAVTFPYQDDRSGYRSRFDISRKSKRFTTRTRNNSISAPPTRPSKKSSAHQDNLIAGITDFGTDAESLGATPYDAATRGLGTQTPGDTSQKASVTHPHQMGLASRAKPTVGMEESVAVQHARQRSRDYNKRRSQSGGRPRSAVAATETRQTGLVETKNGRKTLGVDFPPPAFSQPQREIQDICGGRQNREKSSLPREPLTKGSDVPNLRPTVSRPSHEPTAEKTPEPSVDCWEEQRRVWRQRRKSASEGLLSRPLPATATTSRREKPKAIVDIDANSRAPTMRREPTRPAHTYHGSRESSANFTPTLGLDLRDVPFLLR